MTPPNSILLLKSRPFGARLPKRPPRFLPPLQPIRPVSLNPTLHQSPTGVKYVYTLTENDFRFWAEHELMRGFNAACRGCTKVATSKEDAKGHQEISQCTNDLVAAYKLLLRDKNCVMCDARTIRSRWGIPMCSDECDHKWRLAWVSPPALKSALTLIRRDKVFKVALP